MKRAIAALFLLWTGVLIVAYYVVQKPGLPVAFAGLLDTLWTLLVAALLLFNAYGIGKKILQVLQFERQASIDRLLLGWGIGLGAMGLLGLFVSAVQLADEWVLTLFQVGLALFFLYQGIPGSLRVDLGTLFTNLHLSFSPYNRFTKIILFSVPVFAFLLTLVPPFEAFDALFYHLTQPARVLRDGGLRIIDIPHFWFPNLTENLYLWALGLGSERAAQVLHFAWAMLSALLLWHWASKVWNAEIARKTLLLLASMPALPLLASWAYADMALVFYSAASLYAFVQYRKNQTRHWLATLAVMSGFAISVKYTAFVVPLTCGLLLLLRRPFVRSVATAAQFGAIALLTALPYYARNALLMNNPFYPFVFGGRFWDDFRAAWYGDAGTGIGWDAARLLLLPVNTLLGYQDANFFDGRMGPLFLILAPVTVWVLISRTPRDSAEGGSLLAIGLFSLLSFGAWTIGVINSAALWQARLLFPALVPFAIPTALAWDSLRALDTSRLRIGFLVNALIAVVLTLTVFDQAVFVLQRNPL
ncbi:MAG TPA: glycosyltransferase family 39 protein, partial [Anaerolineales bacterium]|nr:glycosyltransferase family 39 protein [Anaerolineales bacterium]